MVYALRTGVRAARWRANRRPIADEPVAARPGAGRACLLVLLVGLLGGCQAVEGDGEDEAAVDSTGQEAPGRPTAPGPTRRSSPSEPARTRPPGPADTAAAPDVPSRPEESSVSAWMDNLDAEGRIGQLLMLRVYGGGIDEADPRNEELYGVATPREVIETFRPGGVLLFRTDGGEDTGNLRDPRQVRELTDDLREVSARLGPPVVVAIDQEGGRVDRIGHFGTPYPTARDLAEDPGAAAEQAETTITELAALGIDMNFAPVADVDSEAANPVIGDRAYSRDPEVVAEMVLAQLERYRDRPVVAGLKHFPGHGDTTRDSHTSLPMVDADLDQLVSRELVPFAAAIEAGARVIMTAHLELPEIAGPGVPASMSPAVVTDLLRGELGFEGLIVTDSLEMAGAGVDRPEDRVALHALLAGHDLLVLPPAPRDSVALLERALATEQLAEARVGRSVERLLQLKATLHDEAEQRPDPEIVGRGTAG